MSVSSGTSTPGNQTPPNRRQFLSATGSRAILGVGALGWGGSLFWDQRWAIAQATVIRSANQQVNIACCGVGGKGLSDMIETSAGHNIVAICDVDSQHLAQAAEKFPNARRYSDWRKMLEQADIDAVTVSTPDHMHAPITMTAMGLGKHVYTQKPLTHNVYEARQIAHAAQTQSVVTQMGTQHHSAARIKNAVQIIHDGVIGKVRQVHAWTDRPGNFWKQGLAAPAASDPIPASVDWDAWLGVAPARPYKQGLYHAFHWRGWWDFGTGAGGDMGCHLLDPVFTALELTAPLTVSATGPEPDADSGPLWCEVKYNFPGTPRTTENVEVIWYEAGRKPDPAVIQAPDDWAGSENGVLFVGEKGNLFVGFPEAPQLFPVAAFADYQMPDHPEGNHYTQWTAAIVGDGETSCPFEKAGPLTEAVLLGNVAFRSGAAVDWDRSLMLARGNEKAESFIRRTYRSGWEVEGLG